MRIDFYRDKMMELYWDYFGDEDSDFFEFNNLAYNLVDKAKRDSKVDLYEFLDWCDELKENGVI